MDYDKELEKKQKENELYLNKFASWLKNKGLNTKTINKHINNVEFYINVYLNYYDITDMQKGCMMLDDYFSDFFIHKCMWSTANSTKTTATSIKKFYMCMNELGYVTEEDYKFACAEIKENMEYWQNAVEDYNSGDFFF